MLQHIEQEKTNHIYGNGIDITSYLSPKKINNNDNTANTNNKHIDVNNYWRERYESSCPYLEHLNSNLKIKNNKKSNNSKKQILIDKKPKKVPLYLPYNTRKIDPDHHNRLSVRSNNELARFKVKMAIESTPGIQRWPEEKQRTADSLGLAGKRPLSAARPLSPVRSASSRPPSGILTRRIHRDINNSYKYLQDAYESIINNDDDEIVEEDIAVAELRAALLAILNNDNDNSDMIPSALRQSSSPSKFSDLNHIMTLQNFDPSNPPNNHLYSKNNNDDEHIDYVNDDVNRFYRKHNGPSMQFIGNDSIYTVDATKKLKEFIDDDEPSLIDFSIYESKPSDYTKRLRSIVQDNHDDGSVADESNNNNINFNSISINVESNDKDTSSIIIMNDAKTNASTDDTTTNDDKANDTKPNVATTAIGVDTKLRQLFSDRSFAPRSDPFAMDYTNVNIDEEIRAITIVANTMEEVIPEVTIQPMNELYSIAPDPVEDDHHGEVKVDSKDKMGCPKKTNDHYVNKLKDKGKPSSPKFKHNLVIDTNTHIHSHNHNSNSNSVVKSPNGSSSKSPKNALFGQANFLDSLNNKKSKLKKVHLVEKPKFDRFESLAFIDRDSHMQIWKVFNNHVSNYNITKDNQQFIIMKSLGRGKFAEVFGATMMPSMTQVALKRASYDKDKNDALVPVKIIEEFKRGIVVEPLAIATELMDMGNLASLIKNEYWKETLDLRLRTKLSSDIAAGLAYIHSKGFVHRDIKPHNIVINKCYTSKLIAKLCDFGSCVQLDTCDFLTEECGTLGYTAPEVYDPGKYNHSADVFSFSMVLWQLYSHKPELPYHGNEKVEFMNELGNGKRPVYGSEHPGLIKELLDVSWDARPLRRPAMRVFYCILRDLLLEQDSFILIYDKQLGLDGLKRYSKLNGDERASTPKINSDNQDDDTLEFLDNIKFQSSQLKKIQLSDDEINKINHDIDMSNFNVEDDLHNELEL